MIEGMRTLALDYLLQQLSGHSLPDNPEIWYQNLRNNSTYKLLPYLVEDTGKIDTVYVLQKVDKDTVSMTVQDVVNHPNTNNSGCTPDKLPFMKPSGSQSPQVGPVFKRTFDKSKGTGPTGKILKTTLGYFDLISQGGKPWSQYFQQILEILNLSKLQLIDGSVIDWQQEGYISLLECAVDKIGPQKGTVFLTVKDGNGLFPGEVPQYTEYLLTEKLAGERYVTGNVPAKEKGVCPLCFLEGVTVFPNALKGAGINLKNADRAGTFPGLNPAQAWKGYALCGACSDLLYIYKNHVLKKVGPNKDRMLFGTRIAGDSAIIIPTFLPGLPTQDRQEILYDLKKYVSNIATDITADEEDLLDVLKDQKTILNLVILWASVGQCLENVTGMITGVLPSRLRQLSLLNEESGNWQHPLFPQVQLNAEPHNFKPDLSLKALKPFFQRPGGKKAKDANESKKLFQVKKHLANCVYHRTLIMYERFWEEIIITARWYWLEAINKKDGYKGLVYEGMGKNGPYLTPAGWIKHVNWWIYYLKQVGVIEMERYHYQPSMTELTPYFGPESGIDTPEKAYSFLLGVLYGRLLQVQGGKGVNVAANALTWLKRLTLKGSDLPELYIKIRSKLLAYESEKDPRVRQLLTEIGNLGVKLGDKIVLSEVQTNYYLLLGQSMTTVILPKKEEKGSVN